MTSILPTSDGGFLLGGYSISPISGDKTENSKGLFDYWIIKIKSDGTKQWDKTIGGSNNDGLNAMALHGDQYVLAGSSISPISGDKSENPFSLIAGTNIGDTLDYWVVRIDAGGNVVWDKTVGSTAMDSLSEIFVTTTGDYVLAGTSRSPINFYKSENPIGGGSLDDFWVVKINSSTGAKIWDNTIGGFKSDLLSAAIQCEDGGFVLVGPAYSSMGGDNTVNHFGGVNNTKADYWAVKIDSNGQKLWDRGYGGVDDDTPICIIKTLDKGYLIGGSSISGVTGNKTAPSKGSYDYWIVKTDINGIKQWDAAFGGNNQDIMQAVLQNNYTTSQTGFLLGGFSSSPISGDKTQNTWNNNFEEDYWVIQTTSP